MSTQHLIIMIGLPASTKSKYTRTLWTTTPNAVVISRDILGGTIISLIDIVEKQLDEGHTVILDNTNLTKAVRKLFIDIAKKKNIPVHGYYMNTTAEDCQIRHLYRMHSKFGEIYMTGKTAIAAKKDAHIYPPIVIFKAKNDLEVPTVSEGFDKLITKKVGDIKWEEKHGFINKALFLDIDGTLRRTEHLPNKYPTDPSEVELLYDAKEMRAKLDKYVADGYKLIGVSNQSGIAKGTITEETAKLCFNRVRELLGYSEEEFPINYCSHRSAPIVCFCRKPQSGMGVKAIVDYKLNPKSCLMVGDMTSDKTFATRLGIPYMDVNDFWKGLQ